MSAVLLTVAEVAERLKTSEAFVYRQLRAKKLRGSNLGGKSWRISEDDLQRYIDARANLSKVRRSA
jgi:excisionase family DNA binding protein